MSGGKCYLFSSIYVLKQLICQDMHKKENENKTETKKARSTNVANIANFV